MNLRDGLIAYWPLDGNANDFSGNGNNCTIHGAQLTSDRFGNLNSAFNFDGGSSYLECTNFIGANTSKGTVSAWIFKTSTNPNFHETIASTEAYRFQTRQQGQLYFEIKGGAGFEASPVFPMQLGMWHHVSIVKDSLTAKLYQDGVLIFSAGSGSALYPISKCQIGINGASGLGGIDYFNGKIDEVRIYNRALSSSEIQSLYHLPARPADPVLVPTNRLATILECGVGTIPTDNRLKVFTNGVFQMNGYVYQNQMTIVLTHGWNSNPDVWAKGMAAKLLENVNGTPPNIVAWDWEAKAAGINPFLISQFTPGEGIALGKALIQVLGPNYNQPIHFIGHSLGTLVNSEAADYLHKDISWWLLLSRPATASGAYQPANTHVTLFDEAELAEENAAGIPNIAAIRNALLAEIQGKPRPVRLFYDQPLPKQKVWADNYISFVGLFHDDAVNVVLTNKLDGLAASHNVTELVQALTSLHGYPCEWYSNSVVNPSGSAMGNRWSFEHGGFTGAPLLGSVFQQAYASSQLDLTPGDPVTIKISLVNRLNALSAGLGYTLIGEVKSGVAAINGVVQGAVEEATANDPYALSADVGDISSSWAVQFKLRTSKGGGASPLKSGGVHPADADGSSDNVPAYVWAKVTVPSNGVSMSFDFMLEGDGNDDLFAAAVNGTNVLSIETSLLATNELMNSGLINIAQWAGKDVELFFGIQGGTSTNATVTVQSIRFYENAPPSLHAQASGNDFVLTWPLSAQDFNLQSTTNLADTNSWTTLTNVPAIADLQNAVTNPVSGGAKFYRLKK